MASSTHGGFVWYELMTSDPGAAESFYTGVTGWGVKDSGMPGIDYRMFTVAGEPVAGMMALPDDVRAMGVPPHWMGYVGVDDVDASSALVKQLGGRALREPADIPGVGRFSVVADPQGAAIALFRWAGQTGQGGTVGVGWNELYSAEPDQAFGFYSSLFGWSPGEAMPMGQDGVYQLFNHGDRSIGGIMRKPAEMQVSAWGYYLKVTDIDGAADRIAAGGGSIMNGPMQVPGGDWIAQARDPQGAFFAVVGRRL